MVKFLIYLLIFYVVYLVARTFFRIKNSLKINFKKNEKGDSQFKDVEEADYREIDDKQDKKNEQG